MSIARFVPHVSTLSSLQIVAMSCAAEARGKRKLILSHHDRQCGQEGKFLSFCTALLCIACACTQVCAFTSDGTIQACKPAAGRVACLERWQSPGHTDCCIPLQVFAPHRLHRNQGCEVQHSRFCASDLSTALHFLDDCGDGRLLEEQPGIDGASHLRGGCPRQQLRCSHVNDLQSLAIRCRLPKRHVTK